MDIDDIGPCTTALLIPSAPAQVRETPISDLINQELHFIMPQVGSVLVTATTAEGTPLKDGTPITLQLSDDIARAAALGQDQAGQYDRFSGRLGLSVATAYVRNGVAEFSQVGVNTEIAIGKYDREQKGYVVRVLQGPTVAGEAVSTTLALAPSSKKIHLRLENTHGAALTKRNLSATLSWVDQDKKHFGIGEELAVTEEGTALLSLTKKMQQAHALLLTTSSIDFQMPENKPSQVEIGVLLASERMLAEEELEWTIQQGGATLLAGQVADEAGLPFAECGLRLGLRLDDSSQLGSLGDFWEFETDAEGRFRVEAPVEVSGMHWELTAQGRDLGHFAMGVELPFSLGDEAASFVVPRSKRLAGRIVVDDPSQLALMELVLHAGPVGEPGSIYYILDMNGVNGRFQSRRLEEKPYSLVLRSRVTHEQLAIQRGVTTQAELIDGIYQLPDWDFRDKLHHHHLSVKAASGESLEEISITLTDVKDDRIKYRPIDLHFLSTRIMLPITVGALGLRDQDVVISGELEVELQEGIPVQIDFSAALPETDGIVWQAAWMEIQVPTQHQWSTYYGPHWVAVTGDQAQLTVPATGLWTFLLRAAPIEASFATRNAGVLRSNMNPPVVEVGVTGGQLSVTLDPEGLATAIAVVRAVQKE